MTLHSVHCIQCIFVSHSARLLTILHEADAFVTSCIAGDELNQCVEELLSEFIANDERTL